MPYIGRIDGQSPPNNISGHCALGAAQSGQPTHAMSHDSSQGSASISKPAPRELHRVRNCPAATRKRRRTRRRERSNSQRGSARRGRASGEAGAGRRRERPRGAAARGLLEPGARLGAARDERAEQERLAIARRARVVAPEAEKGSSARRRCRRVRAASRPSRSITRSGNRASARRAAPRRRRAARRRRGPLPRAALGSCAATPLEHGPRVTHRDHPREQPTTRRALDRISASALA